jgi:hypothetical protein
MQHSQLAIMNLSMRSITHCKAFTEVRLLNSNQKGYWMDGEGKAKRAFKNKHCHSNTLVQTPINIGGGRKQPTMRHACVACILLDSNGLHLQLWITIIKSLLAILG